MADAKLDLARLVGLVRQQKVLNGVIGNPDEQVDAFREEWAKKLGAAIVRNEEENLTPQEQEKLSVIRQLAGQ